MRETYQTTSIFDPQIAILIPCLNEELTIAKVVKDFKRELPNAKLYVFDNNSADRTIEEAQRAGAIVRTEWRTGKGYVVQSMFSQVEADVYVLVDGDDTYSAADVHRLIAPIVSKQADMVVGSRLQEERSQFDVLNRFGNRLFASMLNFLFNANLTDILSGYRAFNRKFVKELPLFSGGFEIESELTIGALQRKYRIVEIPVTLGRRPTGSESKIDIMSDGLLISKTIMSLFRDHKPLTFFGISGLLVLFMGVTPVLCRFLDGFFANEAIVILVNITAAISILASLIIVAVGLILHTIDRRFLEMEFFIKRTQVFADPKVRQEAYKFDTNDYKND